MVDPRRARLLREMEQEFVPDYDATSMPSAARSLRTLNISLSRRADRELTDPGHRDRIRDSQNLKTQA
jgi:hypothetical protein